MNKKFASLIILIGVSAIFGLHQVNESKKTASFMLAVSEGNAAAVISEIRESPISLSDAQSSETIQLLLKHLHSKPENYDSARTEIFESIEKLRLNASRQNNAILPDTNLIDAIAMRDGSSMINILLSPSFIIDDLGFERLILIDEIEHYSRTIPRKDIEELIKARQALVLLEPENSTHAASLESYMEIQRTSNARVVESFHRREDEFNGNVFYTPKSRPTNVTDRSYFFPYVVKVSDRTITRIRLHYTSNDWLFIERAQINIDGESVSYPSGNDDWERDHGDGKIWEWSDTEVTTQMREILKRISESDKTIIRLMGDQYYYDYNVSRAEKIAIKNAFLLEDILNEP